MSSVSWMAEKTSTELIPMLKNAYNLVLAAEIGKSLLEHNLHLKTSYDSLLHSTTPPITPSSSIQDEPTDEEEQIRFIPSRITREAIIEVLNKKNTEISRKLDLAVSEQDKLIKSNTKNTRQLEKEIVLLKSNLDIATAKMQELEEMNERQRKQEELAASKQNKIDEARLEELYGELDKMEREKKWMAQSKSEVEAKLTATLKDLGELKKQFEKFEFSQKDFDALKGAYQRQFAHIEELKTTLEEHRMIIQRLKESGVSLSTEYTEEESSNKHTLLGELEDEYLKRNRFGSSHSVESIEKSWPAIYAAPPSLIGLESVLSKATGMDPQIIGEAIRLINQIEAEHFQEKNLAMYEDLSVDEGDFGIFQDFYPEADLYPSLITPEQMQIQRFNDEPKTFTGKLQTHVQKLFNIVWRWCRFSVILTTALLVNAWHGPDSLLITY
ncbi:hypothetical protein G6F56_010499 [Rhizopus delemar]|nr:hypothetical protein G6F56_010499 [Rhizopus delemar]